MTAKIGILQDGLDLLKQALEDVNPPAIGFVGQRAGDSEAFDGIVDIQTIVSLDYGKDAEILSKSKKVISEEATTNLRKNCYSDGLKNLFTNRQTVAQIEESLPRGSILIPYSADKTIEEVAARLGYTVLAPKAATKVVLEDKVNLFGLKNSLGLPNTSVLIELSQLPKYEELARAVGNEFVLQLGNGSSGKGTKFVSDERGFNQVVAAIKAQKISDQTRVVITPFVEGPTISISGVITPKQVILFCPGVQVVGNPETAANPATFSGVQFGSIVSNAVNVKTAADLAQKVGTFIRDKHGYTGLFNLNIMANGLLLTDLNPRMMGSCVLMTKLQKQSNEIPLVLLNLLVQLGVDFVVTEDAVQKIRTSKQGALIILHSLESTVKRIGNDFNVSAKDGFEITGAIPQMGKMIEPEAPILRLLFDKDVLSETDFKLTNEAREVCTSVYKALNIN